MPYIDPLLDDIPAGQRRPILFEVSGDFDPAQIPGLKVSSNLGSIWVATATKESIHAFRTCGAVKRVGLAR